LWFKYNDKKNSMPDAESNMSGPENRDEPSTRPDLRGKMARSLARGGMSGVQVISWESAETALTPKRREIIEILREIDPGSVRALARELGRDKSQVSNDLSTLAELGIIEYEKNGNAKAPRLTQDHIVVEPIV
jgi:predicted transcriptional regulator